MLEQFGLVGNLVVLIVALLILSRASNLTINNAINLASATGLGKTKVGFILVAFSTSLPELFVAIFAVLAPATVGITIGNVLGSNIANVCLILGICLLVMAAKYPESAGFFTKMTREEVGSLNFGLLIASVVPLILLFVGYSSQIVGVILIMIFAFNMYQLMKERKTVEEISEDAVKKKTRKYVFLSILGASGVVACSYFIVDSASFLATSVGIPTVVIGATLVAFGTSVPELATSLVSVRKGFLDLALGNIIGSCFLNITLILGVTFLVSPFQVELTAFSDVIIFSLIANLLLWYILQNKRVNRRDGIFLLIIYAIFLAISFGNAI
jgi:cation:H+ antiporter